MTGNDVPRGTSENGGFFAIDRRIWARVCSIGLNEAVAYLVQACGTGGDNATTAWSVHAVEKYTGIGRSKAKAAIDNLLRAELEKIIDPKPRYRLTAWAEMPASETRRLPGYDYAMQRVIDRVGRGQVISKSARTDAMRAVSVGWLKELPDGQGFALAPKPESAPEWIWLPNTLVTGAAAEIPPLELVRQIQDVMALRLMVDMYQAQVLTEDGGVSRGVIYHQYERHRVGERGEFVVWGFRSKNDYVCWARSDKSPIEITVAHRRDPTEAEKRVGENPGVDFFRRLGLLRRLGLFEWVPTLFESDASSGEMIHPLGRGAGDEIEDQLGRAAHQTAYALLNDSQRRSADEQGLILVPVLQHVEQVALFGVARLRYRPQTKMTGAWRLQQTTRGEQHLEIYRALASRARAGIAQSA
jgi:hypothetical protein